MQIFCATPQVYAECIYYIYIAVWANVDIAAAAYYFLDVCILTFLSRCDQYVSNAPLYLYDSVKFRRREMRRFNYPRNGDFAQISE